MSATKKSEVETLVDEMAELIWKSIDESDWDVQRGQAWMEKQMLNNPRISERFIDLTTDDQQKVVLLVREDLARRRMPQA